MALLFSSFCLHLWNSPTQRIIHTIFCFTYSRICRGNLPSEFAAGIWVGICRSYLPFVSANPFYLFYMRGKLFLFVRFSLLTVFLFIIAVVITGHRSFAPLQSLMSKFTETLILLLIRFYRKVFPIAMVSLFCKNLILAMLN